ncbi:MAG TPA: class I SAM-dependent methyltransferase [Candidatus Udaeobacter sp.]|nr:class I SAM-dependent methyltransferase [Candidatus Udaeobacter sp.]
MLNQEPKQRFSAAADLYGRYRPSYPPALRDFIYELLPAAGVATIADVGCGTGISTRLVAGPHVRVIGIDPNREMLAEAARTTPAELGIEYRTGEATATGLPAASAHVVTVAQAFHWFAVDPTLDEFARILVPGGRCAVYWNLREPAGSPFLAAYDALLLEYSNEYGNVARGEDLLAELAAHPRLAGFRSADFPNLQPLDHQGFFGRVYSSSYVTHGISATVRPAFDAALEALFTRYARDGEVAFAYRTRALAFEIARPAARD